MPTFRVPVNGHEVEIRISLWSGRESVLLDGVEVSRKRSAQFLTAHGFEVVEKSGERAVYEVNVIAGIVMGFALRRNGILIAASPRNRLEANQFGPTPGDGTWSAPTRAL